MAKLTLSFVIFLYSATSFAGIRLPLNTLRDQGGTAHCWAYAMSHLLESRALSRDSTEAMIDIEQDTKYWVDYERMMFIFNSKKDFFLGTYEGGWQIEFFETLLKHGKAIRLSNNTHKTEPFYPLLETFNGLIPFLPVERPLPDQTLISFTEASNILKNTIKTQEDAVSFSLDFLDRYYGKAKTTTQWFGNDIENTLIAEKLLGSDYSENSKTSAFILVKPIPENGQQGEEGWVQYLSERYLGYRLHRTKILKLIETSLDNKWPVSFDNVYHAMTIVGYETKDQDTYYAVSDSSPAQIRWLNSKDMLDQLNLVSVAAVAVSGLLPKFEPEMAPYIRLQGNQNIDIIDNVVFPPGR